METSTMAAAEAFVADRLNVDFAGTGLDTVEFRYDPSWSHSAGDDVILVCGGHEFPVDVEDVEAACAFAADRLQDDAMDELNRPWPELIGPGGEYLGVLAVLTDPGPGVATWALRGQPFCAVGHLLRSVQAAGVRISTAPE
ncbi:hypothetical protein ACWGID_19360 [Kribbella sp. NPDC054772]